MSPAQRGPERSAAYVGTLVKEECRLKWVACGPRMLSDCHFNCQSPHGPLTPLVWSRGQMSSAKASNSAVSVRRLSSRFDNLLQTLEKMEPYRRCFQNRGWQASEFMKPGRGRKKYYEPGAGGTAEILSRALNPPDKIPPTPPPTPYSCWHPRPSSTLAPCG